MPDTEHTGLVQNEILREEIRRQLPPKPRKRDLWAFVNSAFFIWLLSASVLTAGGKWLDWTLEQRAKAASKQSEIMELNLEIASRIVRSHSYFRVKEFKTAFDILNGNPLSREPVLRVAFPVLVHRLDESLENPPIELSQTMIDATTVSSLEGRILKEPDVSGSDFHEEPIRDESPKSPRGQAIRDYQVIWCRIIVNSQWAHLIPEGDKRGCQSTK